MIGLKIWRTNVVVIPANTTGGHIQPLDSEMIATFKKLFRSKLFRFTRSEVESGAYHIQQAVIMIWAVSAYISGYCCELLAKVRCHCILNIAEACGFDKVATHTSSQDRDLAERHP